MTLKKIFFKGLDRITKDGLLTTTNLAAHLVWQKIDSKLFFCKRMQAYLRKSRLTIDAGLSVHDLRSTTLTYVESMRINGPGPYGRYRYCQSQSAPLLYASVYAVLTRSLYGDLDNLTNQDREEWIKYIQSFQCEDGLFRDPEVDCELASTVMWWGWQHLTFHAISALTLLGGVCKKDFLCLESLMDTSNIERWFIERKIRKFFRTKELCKNR